jgi:hypothetical protein
LLSPIPQRGIGERAIDAVKLLFFQLVKVSEKFFSIKYAKI